MDTPSSAAPKISELSGASLPRDLCHINVERANSKCSKCSQSSNQAKPIDILKHVQARNVHELQLFGDDSFPRALCQKKYQLCSKVVPFCTCSKNVNEKQSKATEKQSKKDLSALRKIPNTSRQKGAEKQSKIYHGQSKTYRSAVERSQARRVRRQTPWSGARFCSGCARPSPSAAPRPEQTEGENAKSA